MNLIILLLFNSALFTGTIGIQLTNDSLSEWTRASGGHGNITIHTTHAPSHENHTFHENATYHTLSHHAHNTKTIHTTHAPIHENFTHPHHLLTNVTEFGLENFTTHTFWHENFTTPSLFNFSETWLENFTIPALINITEVGFRNECDILHDIKSTGRPTSVHKLHPSNVELIGALGASFMAGYGAGATNIGELPFEYRGLSFAAGGDANLSTVVTLPNILKVYNPNITGFSIGVGPYWRERVARLNLAVPGAESKDLLNQARRLVRRLSRIQNYDKKWKLISINIGTNDLCRFCLSRFSSPYVWVRNIQRTLDFLYYNLKNTFINLIGIRSNELLKHFQKIPACRQFYRQSCPCLDRINEEQLFVRFEQRLSNIVQTYNRLDFTVVFQPFWNQISFEPSQDNETSTFNETAISYHNITSHNDSDILFMSVDCFHLSEKGHASAAVALWNNMLEPPHTKTRVWNLYNQKLNCLDPACPYLRTDLNADFCYLNDAEQQEYMKRSLPKPDSINPVKIEIYFFIMITLTVVIIAAAILTSNVIQARRRNTSYPNERTYLLSNYQI